jgi:hypothetical protein
VIAQRIPGSGQTHGHIVFTNPQNCRYFAIGYVFQCKGDDLSQPQWQLPDCPKELIAIGRSYCSPLRAWLHVHQSEFIYRFRWSGPISAPNVRQGTVVSDPVNERSHGRLPSELRQGEPKRDADVLKQVFARLGNGLVGGREAHQGAMVLLQKLDKSLL